MRLSLIACSLLAVVAAAIVPAAMAINTDPVVGLRHNTPTVHAFTNVRIVQGPGRVIDSGAIVVRDGTIEAVGDDVSIPADARVWDYSGMTVYPGLIELYTQAGLEDEEEEDAPPASYWSDKVRPERNAADVYATGSEDAAKLRELGFACALIVSEDGVITGHSSLVTLGDGDVQDELVTEAVAQSVMFVYGGSQGRNPTYPTAFIGRIALIRQAMLDAQWYSAAHAAYDRNPAQERPETSEALLALSSDLASKRVMMFTVSDDLNIQRSLRLAGEFDLNLWIKGAGDAYRSVNVIKAAGVPIVVPVNYPKAPMVDTPEDALEVNLITLQHWDNAPANAAVLEDAGVTFALTTAGLKKKGDFYKQVRKAIDRGLSEDAALAALTTVPAAMLGADETIGSIDRGKSAHMIVSDGALFEKGTEIKDVWIDGARFEINPTPDADPRGKWDVTMNTSGLGAKAMTLEITGDIGKLKGTLSVDDSTDVTLKRVMLDYYRLAVKFEGDELGLDGVVRMSGAVDGEQLAGHGQLANGEWFEWNAVVSAPDEDSASESDDDTPDNTTVTIDDLEYLGAFARDNMPAQPKTVFVQGATVWTLGPQGVIENADIIIKSGRISKVGTGLKAPSGATVIAGAGKHVTPGLIDAHSHTGVSGSVNEYGHAVSAEVRIGDAINPRSVYWYRELAGGLTVAHVMHGSANPIGGQNAVVKIRWGGNADDMLMDDATPTIKFALGENVKQANWGDEYTTRYPQTRMGVEQIIRDRFQAAVDYQAAWDAYDSSNKKTTVPPRTDLELEALAEILNGERLIHCHSYRQDEILMLVRVAEDYNFQMGTFQHVLEGYKVADALAANGIGASTFSDWWAYKFEVYDAIPYNGVLMYNAGVVVSFNSDSSELARRMNLEAAKAVKYGGVPQEEALKFVSLNAAIQLRIDDRVGSLEEGKDADFAVWSGNPLSTYSQCEQTWVDGRKYFDIQEDAAMREAVAQQRARLIQKALTDSDSKKPGDKKKSEATVASNPEQENEENCHEQD